jgi:hypothetical protein
LHEQKEHTRKEKKKNTKNNSARFNFKLVPPGSGITQNVVPMPRFTSLLGIGHTTHGASEGNLIFKAK